MSNKEMTKEMADSIIGGGNAVRGYVYDKNGNYDEPHWFEGTPENIANFIGNHLKNDVTITTPMDMLVVNTRYSFLDRCPEQELCEAIKDHLIPIKMGEVEAKPVPSITDSEYNRLCWEQERRQEMEPEW